LYNEKGFSWLGQPTNSGVDLHLPSTFFWRAKMSNSGRYQTGDTSFLRQLNLAVVMRCLRDGSPVYRAQLAEITGLNKTTVSSLVSELIAQGFVLESAPGTVERINGKSGRPAVMLELNSNAGCAVAAEVGVNYLSVAVANFTANVIWRHTERIRHLQGQHAIIDRLLALLHLALEQGKAATDRVLGIAVGVPGLVALDSGAVLFGPNLKWENVPLGSIIRDAFTREGLVYPLFVDNEANFAALAEAQYGVARGHGDVLYISAGVGLGGGIIRSGELYRGVSGFAGEFGHMRAVRGDEQSCGCGNSGCWETLASERALFADIYSRISNGEQSLLSWACEDGEPAAGAERSHTLLTVPVVVDAAQAGDRVAVEALQTLGQALGSGIASLVNALNPELVVLGGSLSLAGELLLPAIDKELSEHALRWNRSAVRVVIAQHRFDACVMGGIATVIEASQLALAHTSAIAHSGAVSGSSWAGVLPKGREPFGTFSERR
jgi:glucokinase-like ROK family protein